MQRDGLSVLAHVLESFSDQLKIVGQSTSSMIDADSPVHAADVALISANLSEGGDRPQAGAGNSPEALRPLYRAAGRLSARAGCGGLSAGVMGVCGRNESCEILGKCIDRVYHGQIWAIASSCVMCWKRCGRGAVFV